MPDDEKLKKFLKEHGKEIIERLSAPVPKEVWEETERIKYEHEKEWAKIKDLPIR
jgi:hypothetical protein